MYFARTFIYLLYVAISQIYFYIFRASGSLPYLEPHVLAGHVPRLVVSIAMLPMHNM